MCRRYRGSYRHDSNRGLLRCAGRKNSLRSAGAEETAKPSRARKLENIMRIKVRPGRGPLPAESTTARSFSRRSSTGERTRYSRPALAFKKKGADQNIYAIALGAPNCGSLHVADSIAPRQSRKPGNAFHPDLVEDNGLNDRHPPKTLRVHDLNIPDVDAPICVENNRK